MGKKQKKRSCVVCFQTNRGGEWERFSHLVRHYRGGTMASSFFSFFFISMWKGWRPAEHSWLWQDPGTIPRHAHANHPQQPRCRPGQTECLQHSDLPVRPLRAKLSCPEVCRIITCPAPILEVPVQHKYELILLTSCEDEGCIHRDITKGSFWERESAWSSPENNTALSFQCSLRTVEGERKDSCCSD